MNYVKSKYRSTISNKQLESILKLDLVTCNFNSIKYTKKTSISYISLINYCIFFNSHIYYIILVSPIILYIFI